MPAHAIHLCSTYRTSFACATQVERREYRPTPFSHFPFFACNDRTLRSVVDFAGLTRLVVARPGSVTRCATASVSRKSEDLKPVGFHIISMRMPNPQAPLKTRIQSEQLLARLPLGITDYAHDSLVARRHHNPSAFDSSEVGYTLTVYFIFARAVDCRTYQHRPEPAQVATVC